MKIGKMQIVIGIVLVVLALFAVVRIAGFLVSREYREPERAHTADATPRCLLYTSDAADE